LAFWHHAPAFISLGPNAALGGLKCDSKLSLVSVESIHFGG
jgi:hypothetical protein